MDDGWLGEYRGANRRCAMTDNLFTVRPQDTTADANVQEFLMHQFLMKKVFINLVAVVDVSSDGRFVDIQPIVHGFSGNGEKIEKGVIFAVPVFRLQRGSSAVKMKPVVGDIGMAACCDRDITTVKNTSQPGLPGSNRTHSAADAIYLGGLLNQEPSQYIDFADGEITIHSPNKVVVSAPNVEINADASASINSPSIVLNGVVSQGEGSYGGDATFGGSVTAIGEVTGNGKHLSTHIHGGVQSGSSQTTQPV